jgi:uncharacterized protein (TIGR02147 family)
MDPISIYAFSNYKAFLKAHISEGQGNWGIMTRLAKAAGCQRPYLSRVLSEEAHLTPAQAYGLSRYWKLSEDETEYFLGLLEYERAGSAEYREFWARKNADSKRRHENLSKLVERAAAPNDEKDLIYYSAWYWTAIHILVSIPTCQTEKAIADKLSLPLTQVRSVLETLELWGSVRNEKGQWKFGAREQHISKSSPLSVFHHTNWRQQAILNAQRQDPNSVHFTVVQSLSRDDFNRIKELILDCIQNASAIAGPSAEEKLMCFTCDFFEL